jgi:hypothetical protein
MHRSCVLALLVGCNDLPPAGTCDVPVTGNEVVDVQAVPLVGGPTYFDDLRFAPLLGKVLVPPDGGGQLFVVDPDSSVVDVFVVPEGVGTADANATTIFAGDRGTGRVVAIDVDTQLVIKEGTVIGNLDYVRYVERTNEVWVTIPSRNRIDILDPISLAPVGGVTLPGPVEGLTFDDSGSHAYVNTIGSVISIDTLRRTITGEYDRGCTIPHGFPQIDELRGLAMGGCNSNGGVGVVTTAGDLQAGFEAGSGQAVLAYSPTLQHLYLRGDPGSELHILGVCADGGLGELAAVPIPDQGHVSSADDRGHVWVADATTGSVLRVTDPFPGVP